MRKKSQYKNAWKLLKNGRELKTFFKLYFVFVLAVCIVNFVTEFMARLIRIYNIGRLWNTSNEY